MAAKKSKRQPHIVPYNHERNKHGLLDKLDEITNHYILVLLFLAIVALTFDGLGDKRTIGLIGCILCFAGLTLTDVKLDLWIFVPMQIYLVCNALSSYVTSGTFLNGFAQIQIIYPIIYLLMAGLDERDCFMLRQLCALWAGTIAAAGIVQFVLNAQIGSAWRLRVVLGNPNAVGIFLTIGWFALEAFAPGEHEANAFSVILRHLEPVIFTALALTLSMGSFISLALGIFVILLEKRKNARWKDVFWYACFLLARATIGIGLGVLMYFAARRTDIPWFCVVLSAWLAAAVICWETFNRFLKEHPLLSIAIAGCGVLVAAASLSLRTNAAETFTERFAMMRNGLRYIFDAPLLGVGPYQWRLLNLADGDKYFNTWNIHNIYIHMGVEAGLPVLFAMVVITVRRFQKGGKNSAGFAAFVFHNLIDTSFFYISITAMMMATTGNPQNRGKTLQPVVTKFIIVALLVLYFWEVIA